MQSGLQICITISKDKVVPMFPEVAVKKAA